MVKTRTRGGAQEGKSDRERQIAFEWFPPSSSSHHKGSQHHRCKVRPRQVRAPTLTPLKLHPHHLRSVLSIHTSLIDYTDFISGKIGAMESAAVDGLLCLASCHICYLPSRIRWHDEWSTRNVDCHMYSLHSTRASRTRSPETKEAGKRSSCRERLTSSTRIPNTP